MSSMRSRALPADDQASQVAKVHGQITDESLSPWERYRRVVLGSRDLRFLLRYEVAVLVCGGVPGALGLWLRSWAYPSLMGRVGRGAVFGRDVTLRHPRKIRLGDKVVVDEGCVVDARGDTNNGIAIGNGVMLARGTVLACKDGDIVIGDNVGIGAYTIVHAVGQSGVSIGNNVVIGAYTYLAGGSQYHTERTDIPVCQQGLALRGGISIEDNAWLGARVAVLDGITVGNDAIVGAGAVVTKDVPPFSVAVGVPARVVQERRRPL